MLAASAAVAGGTLAAAKLAHGKSAGERVAARKQRYRLEPGESAKKGISRVARGELDLTIELLEGGSNGDGGAESVHEARKALKRLRTLLRVSRPALEERRYRREKVTFRNAGRELAPARDAQVLLETLDGLIDGFGDDVPSGTWSRLRKELAAGAKRAQGHGHDNVDAVLDVLSQARSRVSKWPLPSENGRASLAEGFDRIYRRGRRALRRAKADPDPETLHELRKRAKDLWHAAQLLEPASAKKLKRTAKAAHHLSNLLGDDHDLSVLLDYAHQHPEFTKPKELELLKTVVDRRRKALRRQSFDCAERLYRRKPKRMLRRLALA